MPNAAHRLHEVLSRAVAYGESTVAADSWAAVFGVRMAQHDSDRLVLRRLMLLQGQVRQLRLVVGARARNPTRFDAHFARIDQVLGLRLLGGPWVHVKGNLPPETLEVIMTWAETLPEDELAIAQVRAFAEEAAELSRVLADDELPADLATFLRGQLVHIETALAEYEYGGPDVVIEHANAAAQDWATSAPLVVYHQDNVALKRTSTLWRDVVVAVSTTYSALQFGAFVFVDLPQLVDRVRHFLPNHHPEAPSPPLLRPAERLIAPRREEEERDE